ncbi:innexin unc-9-like [Mytilus trossulus]|uniref:innexin unc-9-like n=1 Tax=Mytilus trossulus TaxID=6551 RepID=UPI0030057B98
MIGGALGGLASWSRLTGSADDDWIDRINHIWSVVLLTVFTIIVSSAQYVGDPIHCWMPGEFSFARIAYAKSTCWISNTYYIPMDDTIPEHIEMRQNKEITYYQWIPIILMFMAFLFKVPNIAWRLLNGYSGIDMNKIVSMSNASLMSSPDDRTKNISQIAKYLHRWIECQQDYHSNILVRIRHRFSNIFCFCYGKRDGTFLTGYYLFIKMLYCANVVGQFFLLNAFMAMDYNVFGFEVLDYLLSNGEWKESPRFPRVTLCDFQIRQLNNVQRYTIQCVLPINLFNEKIFIFIWFWLFLVSVLTFINYFSWVFYCTFKEKKLQYVKKYLKMEHEIRTGMDKKLARKFVETYLRDDGVFILRVIGKNSSDMVLTDLVVNLWKIFKDTYVPNKKSNRSPGSDDTDYFRLNGGDTTKENYV